MNSLAEGQYVRFYAKYREFGVNIDIDWPWIVDRRDFSVSEERSKSKVSSQVDMICWCCKRGVPSAGPGAAPR